jgi:hypothetical protein
LRACLHHRRPSPTSALIPPHGVLHATRAKDPFPRVAGFLQDADRGDIVGERQRKESQQPQVGKGITCEQFKSLGCDSAAPHCFTEPVTHLGRISLHVRARNVPEAANGHTFDVDCKVGLRLGVAGDVDERVRVLCRIRVRKSVAQMLRDVEVVRVAHDGVGVRLPPSAQRAQVSLKEHRSFSDFLAARERHVSAVSPRVRRGSSPWFSASARPRKTRDTRIRQASRSGVSGSAASRASARGAARSRGCAPASAPA